MENTLSIIAIALGIVALIVALIGSPVFIYIALKSFLATKEFGEVLAAYRDKKLEADQALEEAAQLKEKAERTLEEAEQAQ